MNRTAFVALLAGAALGLAGNAGAVGSWGNGSNASAGGAQTASGGAGELAWTAQSLIVGMTPTAAAPAPRFSGPGNPIFHASPSLYSGVVPIIMARPEGNFICSASLINRNTLLTAAHCVSSGAGIVTPSVTTAFFQQNLGPSDRPPTDGVATAITISEYFINPLYTGQVVDYNDIAILRLSADAPSWAQAYDMSLDITSLRGVSFNVAGYGNRSTVGGGGPAGGATTGTTGFLRQGDNMFDFRYGDADFQGLMFPIVGPSSRTEFSYVSDFDNGVATNDAACRLLQASNFASLSPAVRSSVCNLGRGATEVSVAGGDSGGPQFVDGRIVSVTSFGQTFGTGFGDCRNGLQSSCGELNGFAPLYASRDWIRSVVGTQAVIPEPATWGMMIAGFGLVGFAARRRRMTAAA